MPVRTISQSNGGTTHIVSDVNVPGKTKVKRVTLGRPVRRVQPASGNMNDLGGVDASNPEDGDVLVYNETTEKWTAQKLLDKQIINGGQY